MKIKNVINIIDYTWNNTDTIQDTLVQATARVMAYKKLTIKQAEKALIKLGVDYVAVTSIQTFIV